MKYLSIILVLLLLACGGGGDGSSNGSSAETHERLASTSSLNPNCANLSGAGAVYFDLESGFLVKLSFTPLLANTGGIIQAGDGSIWSFPGGYSAQVLASFGVTISRNDSQVFFKHSTGEQLARTVDLLQTFNAQLNAALATFSLSGITPTFICGRDVTDSVGPLPRRLISGYYEAGNHTFIIKIDVIDTGTFFSLATKVAVAPTQEFSQTAGNVFLPMVWEQFPGGSGPQPECKDGINNDNDLLIDFPNDPECKTPEDDDEMIL